MFPRSYNCATSGIDKRKNQGGIFATYFICHAHPKATDAKNVDRPDIARCMSFFLSTAENEANKVRKAEYLAATAEDHESLNILRNADKHSETTDVITEATGSIETDEPVAKKIKI